VWFGYLLEIDRAQRLLESIYNGSTLKERRRSQTELEEVKGRKEGNVWIHACNSWLEASNETDVGPRTTGEEETKRTVIGNLGSIA
jgi:hypothetical protein